MKAQSRPCTFCQCGGGFWDVLDGHSVCPDCIDALVVGEGGPLAMRNGSGACVACSAEPTVRYGTYPLRKPRGTGTESAPVFFRLCGTHVRAYMARSLTTESYSRICAHLAEQFGLEPDRVFLLHEAFYSDQGQALSPLSWPGGE